jgi:DNA helicase II / ATP-dependent DNA helicase PcrA
MEFPAICVVMSPSTAKGVVDFLTGDAVGDSEEARKVYVGASRAQRLLAIALPQTQAPRLRDLMLPMGGAVEFTTL